tara:strand:- start:16895 stop:17422 length:528 start_codon:yes stop_codon:yes gene_type:complete
MGTDKAMIPIDGEPMISRIVSALAEAGLEPIRISVSSPDDVEGYGSSIDEGFDVEWVLDSRPFSGPIEAIEEALLDPQFQEIEFLQLAPVDYPWVSAELFKSLRNEIGESDSLIMPFDGEKPHPLLALVRPETIRKMLRNGDRRPLHRQFKEVRHSLLMEDPRVLRNVNRPEDLN